MSDDRKPPTPSITGSRLIDVLQAHESRAFRVFWATVGKDAQRRRAAKEAWDRLDALLLPEATFEDSEFDLLTRCIGDELKRQNAVTALPTQAAPDAETQPPTRAPPSSTSPSNPVRRLPKQERSAPAQMTLVHVSPVVTQDFFGAKAAEFEKERPATTTQLALPVVPEPERAIPTLWLRSAIFGVVERGKREDRRMHELPTPWAKGKLYFTGIQLAQDDLDVLLQMLQMASSQGGPGEVIHFTDRGMTKALGRSYGTKTLEWLDEVAHRLMAAVIVLDDGTGGNAQFHLVRSYARNAQSGQRAFVVDPEVMHFFADKKYTLLQWEQRLQLSTGLAKWLHGFLMSQPSSANGIGLALLKELSGVAATRPLRKFRADLNGAIKQLQGLEDPHLGLTGIAIVEGKEGPKLTWQRKPNRQQALKPEGT